MPQGKALAIRIGLFAIVAFVAIWFGYQTIKEGRELPVYSPSELNPELVDSTMQDVSSGHTIKEFSFVNQEGDTLTRDYLKDKVTVVNFFFTTCQGICPEMNSHVHEVVEEYEDNDRVQFLSHTVDPSYDSVPVLNQYAQQFGADPSKWSFVTGSKQEIYRMARQSYFAVKSEGDGGKSDFIHTENLILVDPQGRLRGFYDGTSDEDVGRLMEDVEVLLD